MQNKKTIITILILTAVLVAIGIYPFKVWDNSLPILIWGCEAVIIALALALVIIFKIGSVQATEQKSKYDKLAEDYKDSQESVRYYRRKADDSEELKSQTIRQKKEIESLNAKLANKTIALRECRQIYACSSIDSTRLYALTCFDLPSGNGMKLFDPVKYLQNPAYSKVIDTNAEQLYEMLISPVDNTMLEDNAFQVQKELDRLLKSNSTSATSIVKERQRKPLEHITDDMTK